MWARSVPPGRRDAPVCMRRRRADTSLSTRDAAACVRRRGIRGRLARSAVSRGGGRRPESSGGPGGRRGAGWPRASRPPRRARLHAPPSSGRDAAESGGVSCALRRLALRGVSRRREHGSPAPRGTGLWWSYGLGRTGRPYAGFCPATEVAVTAISLGPTLPSASSGLPEDSASSLSVLCLTLLRARFTEQIRSPGSLVVSYTTVSPLPTSPPAVCSLWHCLADCSGWVLPTALLCGARTFLGTPGGVTRPSHRPVRSDECTGTPAPPGSDSELRPVDRSRHPARRPPSGHEMSVPHAENDVS